MIFLVYAINYADRHTGNHPGLKIIDMKFINDKRQYRADIRSVGVIDIVLWF
jgi:hypothetical protein